MRRKIALLGLIAVACNCQKAFAEAINEEVVFHQRLFNLGDVYQSVFASYNYTSHSLGNKTSSSQNLGEGYGIATQVAILDPDVVLLDLAGGVSYQQRLGNSEASLLDWSYNVSASGFKQSYHPMQLSSVRSSSTISTGYMPSYTVERTFNKFGVSLLHQSFPVYIYLTNSTVATQGLNTDTTTDTSSGGLSVNHNGGWFISDAMLNFGSSRASGTESRVYSVTQNNTFDLDSQKRYRFLTKASMSDSISESSLQSIPQRIALASGLFTGQLGKALGVSLSDDYNYSSTNDFNGNKQTIQSNTISAGLSHSLYQSLTTSVSTSYGKTFALGGGQSVFNGTAALAYRKRLPAQSQLSLRGTLGKSFTRQDFADTVLAARDEQHTVRQGDFVTPNLNGKLRSVLSVKSVDPIDPPWFEGTDYRVDYDTGKIEILRPMAPDATVAIYITYEVGVNQNVDFTTDTQNYQALLALYGGRYSFSANYSTSSEQRISGVASNNALNSTTTITLSGEARYQENSFTVEYGNVSTSNEDVSRLGAAWTYDTYLRGADHLRVTARNTYTMHAETANQAGYDQNILSASTTYSRSLFQGIRMALMCNVSDSRTADTTSDVIGLRTSLDGNFNSLTVTLTAGTRYHFSSGPTSQDTDVNLKITRAF